MLKKYAALPGLTETFPARMSLPSFFFFFIVMNQKCVVDRGNMSFLSTACHQGWRGDVVFLFAIVVSIVLWVITTGYCNE